jgi:hypothetical protein
MVLEEIPRLHRIPDTAHTVALGLSRSVPDNTPMVTFENGQYSVPSYLLGQAVFVRTHGLGGDEQVIIVHVGPAGPVEVARHYRACPGTPAINDAHFPGYEPKTPGDYRVKARSGAQAQFLEIGEGARTWLLEAAAAGTTRITTKMAEAVTVAKIAGVEQVDQALATAALYGRFASDDLSSILRAQVTKTITHAAGESKSLTQGTASWAAAGRLNNSAAMALEENA